MAKILQILPALNSGGVERTTLEMVQAIKSVGWQPFVASSGGRMMFEIERAGARHLTLPLQSKSPFVMQRNKNRLTKFIKAGGIDLVHARSRAPAWSARRAITKQDIPFVTTYHGIYSENGLFKRKYNAIMACGDIVIANSEFTKAHLLERHHKLIGDKPVKVVYRGVDLEKFTLEKVGAPRLTHISDQWGLEIEHDLPVFLLPGRITRIKGHDILIEAAAKLREEGHDFIIVCAGDFFDSDNYFGQLQRRVEKRKLQNIIRFVGHVEDMPAAMAAGDFVICASTQPEAFGRVMAEGLAMRRPVIASNHGGAKEIVGDGQSGYLVTPVMQLPWRRRCQKCFLIRLKGAPRWGRPGAVRLNAILPSTDCSAIH